MDIVRNGINIEGITEENELPAEISGQLIELSETENLLIDKDIKIKNIHKISVDTEIKGTKIINAPLSRIFVIDGYKKLEISYFDTENNLKAFKLDSPFNIFFDVENSSAEVDEMRLHIADAYFELTAGSVLYCYIIYMADIRFLNYNKEDKQETMIKISNQNEAEINKQNKAAALEMSISKEKTSDLIKTVPEEDTDKNNLMDIEAEYL